MSIGRALDMKNSKSGKNILNFAFPRAPGFLTVGADIARNRDKKGDRKNKTGPKAEYTYLFLKSLLYFSCD